MTALTDFLVSVLVIGIIILIFYLKMSKKTFKDLMLEIRDLMKQMKQ